MKDQLEFVVQRLQDLTLRWNKEFDRNMQELLQLQDLIKTLKLNEELDNN